MRLSEDQINRFIASQGDALKPIDSAKVQLLQDEVRIDVRALGLQGSGSAGLAVQNGKVIAINPRVEGALGQFVSAADLARTLEAQINGQLTAQGRRITDIRIEPGVLVVTVSDS